MNWIRRAVLYNARKKGKTLLLFLLLLVIEILLLICFFCPKSYKNSCFECASVPEGRFFHR